MLTRAIMLSNSSMSDSAIMVGSAVRIAPICSAPSVSAGAVLANARTALANS
jgi:hypothetical protein